MLLRKDAPDHGEAREWLSVAPAPTELGSLRFKRSLADQHNYDVSARITNSINWFSHKYLSKQRLIFRTNFQVCSPMMFFRLPKYSLLRRNRFTLAGHRLMTLKKIKNEISGTVFSLPYYVARELGYFEAEGLEVEFVKRKGDPVSDHNPLKLVEDHKLISSFGGLSPFETGETVLYRACEWGQVRRTQDSTVGGQVVAKRAARASQAIIVRPDSPVLIPQDLANVPIGVNFHHGSHYVALQLLEGFLPRDEIKVVHIEGSNRFLALQEGHVDAVAVMEPWITVAEKLGYKTIAEAHYVGLEIGSPDLDVETFDAINRAVRKAVKVLKEDPYPYVKYLIGDVDPAIVKLEPKDFSRSRLRYDDPAPYSQQDFDRTYNWMLGWGLIQPNDTYEHLVDNRLAAVA
jgi:NitT/TauT family transport system substrate-binding protein